VKINRIRGLYDLPNIHLKTVLAKNIKKLRSAKGFSQEELAEKAKVSLTYIGMIESGLRNASFKTIEQIAEALEIEAPKLFEIKDNSSKSPASKVKEGIKILFYDFVRDALEEIVDQE
jgi:transcriptional regulator with XRE-family HTH domain